MGERFAAAVQGGPVLLAVAAAALAGLVSFLSPCILPLVPGYLSYVTGLAGADLDAAPRRGRVLLGTSLFVVGFAAVFVPLAVLFSTLGRLLADHQRALEAGVGLLVIGLGLAFLGLVPGLGGQRRLRLPAAGLLGAPVFGAVFALSWTPCVGPTLGAVLGLAATSGQAGRAVVLAVAYTLGLGLPFVVFGLGFRRLLGLVAGVRRHSRWVTRVGGALLVAVGLALVSGGWAAFVIWLRGAVGVGQVGL
ncbi:cytochrome C biogenesis protein CcdA [Pilimelia terevasa]|uniref:Cytochrome C biogenesis protein CcdA n=1 Tax=Pilimelia terevasa TaxID=53372 RepID=A0A8J3BME4_9ACTN|nr:cytochrome c biogenesis protein CcdA [Pilimelia terevasa]GGK21653.1 cytochrome C biogenesis protein CcdA [Pilimelia terevasa]